MIDHIEFHVEEHPMEVFLKAYLPTVLQPGRTFETLNYQGKPALLRKLRDRLQGYARWLPNSHRIIILVDRDNDDCQPLKCQLECTCQRARLRTKSQGGDWQVAIRIVTEELEAWYSVTGKQCEPHTQNVDCDLPRRYREPDAIKGGTWEAFERVMQKSGYFRGGLAKAAAVEAIAPHINAARSRSASFRSFVTLL